jgi:hypothetical protein
MIVDKMDAESIWQELQLRDGPLLKWCRGTTAKVVEGDENIFYL